MKVVVLTGGVGGARFLRGIVDAIDPAAVTAIVNVGDDLEVLGLSVSPDLDSVLYALAGISDEERGWGRADETWNALASVEALGGESWFRLGDRDLGLHVVRTNALRTGAPLSAVTARLAAALGVDTTILPATDDVAPHVARHAERQLLLPGVVRGARTPRPGRPRALRGCDRGATCARGARGDSTRQT